MNKAIIIGAGLGGLFCGAILAKEGFQVTVLEKNATVGGGLQSFKRFGVIFDTGMHVISGMQPDGNIRRICRYLGIADKVHVRDVDDECTDRLYFAEDQRFYTIRKGKEGYIESLSSYFPEEKEPLKAYVEAIYRLTDEFSMFDLRPSTDRMVMHSDDFLMPADAFIAKYVKNPKLRSVIAYMNPLYGGRHDETPAFVHAIINVLYINGASRFEGGSLQFAQLLVELIERAGGHVVVGDGVKWIEVNDRHVDYVETQKGVRYEGDCYISAIHPCALLRLLPDSAFTKAYRTRLEAIPNSYSAFSLYIKLKEKSFPYINHSEYYMSTYEDIWNFGEKNKRWPLGFLFMTPPDEQQGAYSNKVLLTAPMLFDEVLPWEDTTVGHRGEAYLRWKREKEQLLLERIEELHPGFGNCIEHIISASPLTIRDFYGVKGGSMCGYSKDCRNMALSQVPVVTKVRNLYMTGQNNNLHGFSGVPLTAITTAEAILGQNYIINKIRACEQDTE